MFSEVLVPFVQRISVAEAVVYLKALFEASMSKFHPLGGKKCL